MTRTPSCPECGSSKFQLGPRGGDALNVRCENHHYWNVTPFGWERLEPPAMKEAKG